MLMLLCDKFNIRGIRGDVPDPLIGSKDLFWLLSYSQSQNICGLKLLAIESSTLERFNGMSGDLIWFRLHQSKGTSTPSIPSTLLLTNLRVLEVHGVTLRDFCKLFYDREPPSHLRELKVTCPLGADSSTAGFRKKASASKPSYSLRRHIPSTCGQWFQAWLEMLDFKGLGKIVLQNIAGLKTLSIKFKEIRNLRHVDLCGCSDLKVLPDSFTKELSQLQYLAVRDCRKLVLRTLGKISTLEYLVCEGCSMLKKLPRGTKAQKILKYLNVLRTQLTKLPRDFQQLENLEELHIGSPYLREISRLPGSLITLNLLNCSSLRILAGLATLVGLKLLHISGRVKLKTLNLDGLKSMEVLKADKCSKLQSIQGRLEQLQKLSYLQISLASLPRSTCTDILTCTSSISTAVLSGSSMNTKKVDELDGVAGRFEGVKLRRILKSAELEGYQKPKGPFFYT